MSIFPTSAIAVATGDQRELDGIDLFDRTCPIEYVITVEALKEGWDCSFAYVFCSVSRIHSATDVEQLLGRVLRMPFARRRRVTDLNKAYAYLSEPSAGEAARALTDKLVAMGFEEDEARDNIEQTQGALGGEGGLFGSHDRTPPTFRHTLEATPDMLSALKQTQRDGVTVRETGGGTVEIEIVGPVDDALEQVIRAAVPEAEHGRIAESFEAYQEAGQGPVVACGTRSGVRGSSPHVGTPGGA